MKKKALIAIIFAGGMVYPQLPASSDSGAESRDSVVLGIAGNAHLAPELRAFYLLMLADRYLAVRDRAATEAQFKGQADETNEINYTPGWESFLLNFSYTTALEATADAHSIPHENLVLANQATKLALSQIGNSTDKFATLNLYFFAERLYRRIGNSGGVKSCDKFLKVAFQHCETSSPTDDKEIRASLSVLDAMAFGLIPVKIPNVYKATSLATYKERDFEESKNLKLRGIELADLLPANSHVRRKAHRDLVLWYMQLGKSDLAENEKQVLFGLVARKDDTMLYPKSTACGRFVWWESQTQQTFSMACGMG